MWKKGTLNINGNTYFYEIKVYEGGSRFGIDGGKISKLWMSENSCTVCNYDRGWDIKPETGTAAAEAYKRIIDMYN